MSPAMCAESAEPANSDRASSALRWLNQLRYLFCALEYLLARHHHLGWHTELDGEAFESRVLRLRTLRQKYSGKQTVYSPGEPTVYELQKSA